MFELETPLSDEAIKALDDAIKAQPDRASTAAKRKRPLEAGSAADPSVASSSSSSSGGFAGWLPGLFGSGSSSGNG